MPSSRPFEMPKYIDLVMNVLSILVIPLIGWGAYTSTQVAVLETRIEQQQATIKASNLRDRMTTVEEQVRRAQADVQVALGLQASLEKNNIGMARLEEKLNATVETLKEIRQLLRNPVPVP